MSAAHVATYMAGDVIPFRHEISRFYDIITITKKIKTKKIREARWHSLVTQTLCGKLGRFYLLSIINHRVNKRHQNSLSSSLPLVPIRWLNPPRVCVFLILRGHSWLPFYAMR